MFPKNRNNRIPTTIWNKDGFRGTDLGQPTPDIRKKHILVWRTCNMEKWENTKCTYAFHISHILFPQFGAPNPVQAVLLTVWCLGAGPESPDVNKNSKINGRHTGMMQFCTFSCFWHLFSLISSLCSYLEVAGPRPCSSIFLNIVCICWYIPGLETLSIP